VKAMLAGRSYESIQFIVPHQFLTRKLLFPYYGYSSVNVDFTRSRASAKNLSPMLSANISDSANGHGERGICFGDNYGVGIDSLKSLNISNLDSALNSSILREGWFSFFKQSIDIAMGLWFDYFDNLQPEPVNDESTQPIEIKPFVEYENLTREEYLAFLEGVNHGSQENDATNNS
jgi:hypothetical protein